MGCSNITLLETIARDLGSQAPSDICVRRSLSELKELTFQMKTSKTNSSLDNLTDLTIHLLDICFCSSLTELFKLIVYTRPAKKYIF